MEKCGKMCENVENVEKCGKMWKNVEKCVKMCENVLETRFLYNTIMSDNFLIPTTWRY